MPRINTGINTHRKQQNINDGDKSFAAVDISVICGKIVINIFFIFAVFDVSLVTLLTGVINYVILHLYFMY